MHPKSGTYGKRVHDFGSPYLQDPCISYQQRKFFVDFGLTTPLKNAPNIILHSVHGSQ